MQRIPNYVNDANIVLLWTIDEVIPITVLVSIGFFAGHLTVSLLASFVFLKVYRRHRDAHHRGYLLHLMYWIGLFPLKTRLMNNPFVRRLIP